MKVMKNQVKNSHQSMQNHILNSPVDQSFSSINERVRHSDLSSCLGGPGQRDLPGLCQARGPDSPHAHIWYVAVVVSTMTVVRREGRGSWVSWILCIGSGKTRHWTGGASRTRWVRIFIGVWATKMKDQRINLTSIYQIYSITCIIGFYLSP